MNATPRPITPEDMTREADRNYDLGRKHGREEMRESLNSAIAVFKAIDKLTCNSPCMSLQAQHEFERCHDANEYRVALCGLVLEIRQFARSVIAQHDKALWKELDAAQPARAAATPESDGGK